MTDTSCHPLTGEEINSERHRLQGTAGRGEEGGGDGQASLHQGPQCLGRKRGRKGSLVSERSTSRLGKTAPTLLIGCPSWGTALTSILSSSEGRDCAVPAVLHSGTLSSGHRVGCPINIHGQHLWTTVLSTFFFQADSILTRTLFYFIYL